MQIRKATYTDKPAIFEFLARAYAGRSEFKFPERWEWAYEHNPFLAGDAPPVWIAEAPDRRVIGQSAALIEPLVVNGREHRVAWGVDFFVLPEYRGQGIGTRLQAENNAAHAIFMSLSMAAQAAAIKERLGLAPLPEVHVFDRLVHHDPDSVADTLNQRLPWLPAAASKALAPPLARLLTRRDRPAPVRTDPTIEIRRMSGFTEVFDRIWETVGSQYRALVRRDARYLNWKFRDQPHVRHETLTAYRQGDPVGYLILRRARPPERNAGILVDLFTAPEDAAAAEALLAEGLRFFADSGVTFIRAAASVRLYRQLLKGMGFKIVKTVTPLARAPFQLPGDGWLLGKGDHDWDQYPLA